MNKKKPSRGRPAITGLTAPQEACWKAINELLAKEGMPPTVAELAKFLDLVGSTVHIHIQQLIKKGYLSRTPGKARGLHLLRKPSEKLRTLVQVPIVGDVVAGRPLLSEEYLHGELAVDGGLIHQGKYFALRVKGDSMRDANIMAGDYVIVRQQPLAESGDIVVALVNQEATVKRLSMSPEGIFLLPENPKYRRIAITAEVDFQLLGKVIATSKSS
jgi:repressor LexA